MLLGSEQYIADLATNLGMSDSSLTALVLIILLWSITWKGISLWKSAQRKEHWWFVALLLINTVGILEILYIYMFSKDKNIPTSASS